MRLCLIIDGHDVMKLLLLGKMAISFLGSLFSATLGRRKNDQGRQRRERARERGWENGGPFMQKKKIYVVSSLHDYVFLRSPFSA